MSDIIIYMLLGMAALLIISVLLAVVKTDKDSNRKAFTPLAGMAFAFFIAGIIFGEERMLGYALIGIGMILAVIDIFRKLKND